MNKIICKENFDSQCPTPTENFQHKPIISKENFQSQCPTTHLAFTFGPTYYMYNYDLPNINNTFSNYVDGNDYSYLTLTINSITTSPIMLVSSDQTNGCCLYIKNQTGASITSLWLASTDHSDCTYCGILLNNNTYYTWWYASGGNYFWDTPGLLESFQMCTVPPNQNSKTFLIVIWVVVVIVLVILFIFLFKILSQKSLNR